MKNRAKFIMKESVLQNLDLLRFYLDGLGDYCYDFGLVFGEYYKYLGFFVMDNGLTFIYVAADGLVSRYPVVIFELTESSKILHCKKKYGGIEFIPDKLMRHDNWFERYLDEDDEVVSDVDFLIDLEG